MNPPVDASVPALEAEEWRPRAAAHTRRVDRWVQPHLARRQAGEKHPVHDFLFTYYSHRPSALRRWHPGYGVVLLDVLEAEATDLGSGYSVTFGPDKADDEASERHGLSLSRDQVLAKTELVQAVRRLLVATAGRAPSYGCFGLHEWAMVHRAEETRHDWPLRLGSGGTDRVVESHRIACSHFDAFRFFTESARPLNTLQPGRDDRADFEQPGCLHAGMDLYKHAFRLSPLIASELVADCFALAWDIGELDMRASPYDLSDLGYEPVPIETPQGKQAYVAAQRAFAERGAPLRRRLVAECDRLLRAAGEPAPRPGLSQRV